MKLRIKEMAQKRGYTQTSLAKKLNTSRRNVMAYYIRENMSLPTLIKIANALECEVWQLITTEYEVLQTGSGDVRCPECDKRIPLSELEYCFDSN